MKTASSRFWFRRIYFLKRYPIHHERLQVDADDGKFCWSDSTRVSMCRS